MWSWGKDRTLHGKKSGFVPHETHTVKYPQREKSGSKVNREHVAKIMPSLPNSVVTPNCWVINSFITAPPTLFFLSPGQRLLEHPVVKLPWFQSSTQHGGGPSLHWLFLKTIQHKAQRPPAVPPSETPQDSSSQCTPSLLGGLYLNGIYHYQGASQVAQWVKKLPAMQETWVRSLGWEDALEKGMATHCSNLPGEAHGQRSPVVHRVAKSQTLLSREPHRENRYK